MKKISLNSDKSIDLQKLIESRLLIQANSGGGKSWIMRRILEQSHGKVQHIVLDLEGEFSTLREEFDYILIGKDGDVPISCKTAALLAHKILELNVSAIIDMYELPSHERKRFAKLFIDSLVNAPKHLWHNCLVFIDEAHVLCPERGESEAMGSVIDLATRGRKRGYCAVLATQRISKLHKDAAAECNNKLIGRSSQDIDMKRASDELGFNKKEQTLSLRKMKPGEFYSFGPAISDEVEKIIIGSVKTSHPSIGSQAFTDVAPPTGKIKSILQKMSDIPQEAEKKLSTEKEFREEIKKLRRENSTNKSDEGAIKRRINVAVAAVRQENDSVIKNLSNTVKKHEQTFGKIAKLAKLDTNIGNVELGFIPKKIVHDKKTNVNIIKKAEITHISTKKSSLDEENGEVALTNPERRILNAIAWFASIGIPKPKLPAVAFLANYSFGGGAFNTPKCKLKLKEMISYDSSGIELTSLGEAEADQPENAPTQEELHEKVLSVINNPMKRLLKPLLDVYPEDMSYDELAELSGYAHGGGAFNTPRCKLKKCELVEYTSGGRLKAASLLFI